MQFDFNLIVAAVAIETEFEIENVKSNPPERSDFNAVDSSHLYLSNLLIPTDKGINK